MDSGKFLTIAIPTYNRIEKVVARVGELLPQLNDRIEIRIFDNASDQSVEDAIRLQYGAVIDHRFTFQRNRVNIGLAANLCRCFEHSRGEWVWILGDDDVVLSDAVAKVLKGIDDVDSSVCYLSFSTSIYSHASARKFSRLAELTEVESGGLCFSNLLFISSGCYRTEMAIPHLRVGYLMVYSHVPHVAILASMLASGMVNVVVSQELVVERSPYDPKQAWSYLKVISGLPALLDLDGVDPAISTIVSRIILDIRWRPFVGAGIHYIFNDSGRSLRFWWLLFAKIFICGETKMKLRSILLMAFLPLAACKGTRTLVKALINSRFKSDVNDGNNRL